MIGQGLTERLGDSAVMVFSSDDLDAAITNLTRAGINAAAPVDLYERDDQEQANLCLYFRA